MAWRLMSNGSASSVHRGLALGQSGEDRPAGRVGEGGEGDAERVVGHGFPESGSLDQA